MIKIFLISILLYVQSFGIGEGVLFQKMKSDATVIKKVNGFIENGKTKEALFYLESLISKSVNPAVVLSAKITYSIVVLESDIMEPKIINKSLAMLLPLEIEHAKKIPAYDYLIANLYNNLNEQEVANSYLQKACTNENASPGLYARCNGSKNIEVVKEGKVVMSSENKICKEIKKIYKGDM